MIRITPHWFQFKVSLKLFGAFLKTLFLKQTLKNVNTDE